MSALSPQPVRGGLKLAGEKQRASAAGLRTATVPPRLVMGLDTYGAGSLLPVVAAGEFVRLGQLIARPVDEQGAMLHSPVSGTVVRSDPSANTAPGVIVIDNDGRDEPDPGWAPCDFTTLTPSLLCERIAAGGIAGLGGAAFPTHRKLSGPGPAPRHLLLNGVECEPFVSCDDALMRNRGDDIVLGAQAMLHALGCDHGVIAIEADKPDALSAMRGAVRDAGDPRLEVVSVPTFYPAGGERQLITSLWNLEVPTGGLPRDIGVVCQNVGTAAAIATLLRTGEPLIRRVVTITGDSVTAPCNLEVRLGTPVGDLIRDCGGYSGPVERLIAGGSMMGTALGDDAFGIGKATNCIIAASPSNVSLRGAEMPCIRCGDCATVCPAGLLPQSLHFSARQHDPERLHSLGLLDCIECGCCDYVCPSRIPLASTFVSAKRTLKEDLVRRARNSLARTRFDAHTERLAGEKSEREARLREKRAGGRPAS